MTITKPGALELADSCVDVWKVLLTSSERDFSRASELLSGDEKERADRIGSVGMQRTFVMARAALRALLRMYVHEAPGTIRFIYESQGRPRLWGDSRIFFSATRSGEVAAFAFCTSVSIGIDMERLRALANIDRVVERMFSPAEKCQLALLGDEMRLRAFFACWTRKEAYAKATGEGILAPFDQFSVDVNPNAARPELWFETTHAVNDWVLHDLRLGDEYAGALAYRGVERSVRVYDAGSVGELLTMEVDDRINLRRSTSDFQFATKPGCFP